MSNKLKEKQCLIKGQNEKELSRKLYQVKTLIIFTTRNNLKKCSLKTVKAKAICCNTQ